MTQVVTWSYRCERTQINCKSYCTKDDYHQRYLTKMSNVKVNTGMTSRSLFTAHTWIAPLHQRHTATYNKRSSLYKRLTKISFSIIRVRSTIDTCNPFNHQIWQLYLNREFSCIDDHAIHSLQTMFRVRYSDEWARRHAQHVWLTI